MRVCLICHRTKFKSEIHFVENKGIMMGNYDIDNCTFKMCILVLKNH